MSIWRKFSFLCVCVVGVLFYILVKSNAVCADEVPEGYYQIRNVKSGLCLASNGYGDMSNVLQEYSPAWRPPQKYLLLHRQNGYYTMHSYNALNKVVDVSNASQETGANIWLYQHNKTSAQQWKYVSNGDGSFRIMSGCTNGQKAMVVQYASMESGANVFQYTYNGTDNEKWFLESNVSDGIYYIRNKRTGKYLTVYGGYVKQCEMDDGQKSNQQFKITASDDGYYDIAPIRDLNESLGVSGWSMGYDDEGASIYCDQGQSAEGQRWRFLLNGNGGVRIVSELSGNRKAMTVSTDGYVHSVSYNQANNANWELVEVSPEYVKEGKHVVVGLDTDKYLRGKITSQQLARWIGHLDAAYENFEELVGMTPLNGQKIWILACDSESYPDAALYTWQNDRIIFWNEKEVDKGISRISEFDDWCMGILHEMGHCFDIDSRWEFDSEFFASFKMSYLFYKYDGRYNAVTNEGKVLHTYQEFVNTKKSGYIESFGKNPMEYQLDGLIYMYLERIQNAGDWSYIKNAFREIHALPSSYVADTKMDRYNLFMNTIDRCSSGSFLNRWNEKYSAEQQCIFNKLSK